MILLKKIHTNVTLFFQSKDVFFKVYEAKYWKSLEEWAGNYANFVPIIEWIGILILWRIEG